MHMSGCCIDSAKEYNCVCVCVCVCVVTWLVGAVLTVAVVVVDLLKGDHSGAIYAQEGPSLPVETLICHTTKRQHI